MFSFLLILIFGLSPATQEFFPSPPSDQKLIYFLNDQNELLSFSFEQGTTPLNPSAVARSTKTSYIELAGEHAARVLKVSRPRIFLFTPDRPGSHPPFIVSLTAHGGARRVTAISQKGLAGFAISSDQIIKPGIRVIKKEGDLVFMELWPRVSLAPGEYAIIGEDLARIATFRIDSLDH